MPVPTSPAFDFHAAMDDGFRAYGVSAAAVAAAKNAPPGAGPGNLISYKAGGYINHTYYGNDGRLWVENYNGAAWNNWILYMTNSELSSVVGETSNITSTNFTGKIMWQNFGKLTTLSFELTAKKELATGVTHELITIVDGKPSKKANCVLTTSDGKPYYCYSSPDGKFYVANYTGVSIPANKVLYGQMAFIAV